MFITAIVVIVIVLALAVLTPELVAAIIVVVAAITLLAAASSVNLGDCATAARNRCRSSHDAAEQQFDSIAPGRSGEPPRPMIEPAPLHGDPPLSVGRPFAVLHPCRPTPH